MTERLTAQDWIDFALKTLAHEGSGALKADVLARKLGVSRGSFYWHFADIAAYHAAILTRWHEVAAEQIIANVEAASKDENPLALLLRRVFGERLMLERAVRTWASVDPAARARAQILYWAFLGFALSDQPLPKARQQAVLDELLRIAAS